MSFKIKRIAIFGAKRAADEALKFAIDFGLEVECFVVDNIEKNISKLGIPIVSYDNFLLKQGDVDCLIKGFWQKGDVEQRLSLKIPVYTVPRISYDGLGISMKKKVKEFVSLLKTYRFVACPYSERCSDKESIVLLNGIPKSGTYLLYKIIDSFGKWYSLDFHLNFGRAGHYDFQDKCRTVNRNISVDCHDFNMLRKLKSGQSAPSHAPYSRQMSRYFQKRNIKHVFIYRDPRDILVSYTKFAMTEVQALSDRSSLKLYQDLISMDSFGDQLEYIIKQRHWFDYSAYAGWLYDKNTYPIRYESIIEELDNMPSFGNILAGLFDFLGIDSSEIDYKNFVTKAYKVSGFTYSGVRSNYGSCFEKRHYDLLDNSNFKSQLNSLGYSWGK